MPDGATVEELKERGQPPEAEALVEAVRMHLNDDVTTHRGRTELRDEVPEDRYQIGLPEEYAALRPEEPTDGPIDPLAESDG